VATRHERDPPARVTRYDVACPRPHTWCSNAPGGPFMKWVTRARPKTDRIACPWLIRKFIDPEAEILYVPADQVLPVAEEQGAHSFDAPGAEYAHRGNRCSFETLIDEFDLNADAALVRLAKIVHA